MELDTFIRDGGFDPATISETQRKTLTAAWKRDQAPKEEPPDDIEVKKEKANREHKRLMDIAATVEREMDPRVNPHLTAADRDLIATIGRKATNDEWPMEKFELEIMRARRPNGRFAATQQTQMAPEVSDLVIEAAVCKAAGLSTPEKFYDARTLEAADKNFPTGMSICELIMHYARKGGYTGHSVKANMPAAIKAARQATAADIQAAGSWGPSTQGASIGTMLANTANKFFRAGFESVEAEWRPVADRISVSDFKQITTFSLTGDLTFVKLPPGGEIKHGQIDATSYTNQVDTYARMLGLDRRDIINDDLRAFASVARRLGRGGGLALNTLFWGIWLNNSSFYTAGRNNLITGIASPYLTAASLDAAIQKFKLQTDPDGKILGVKPAILVVPPALESTARQLMSSTAFVSGSTTNPQLNQNIYAGMFQVVSSAYMQDSTLTGNSATTWYLIASPADMPVIQIAFLNGKETPTVEEADSDFGMLGQSWRGYFDIGVALQEYRGGVKNTA